MAQLKERSKRKTTSDLQLLFDKDNNDKTNRTEHEHAKIVEQTMPSFYSTSFSSSSKRDKKLVINKLCQNPSISQIMARPLPVRAFMVVLAVFVQVYTWTTLPVYFLVQQPWNRLHLDRKRRIVTLPVSKEHALPDSDEEELCSPVYERVDEAFETHPVLHLETITDMLDRAVSAHGPNTLALGHRKVISEEDSLDENGKVKRIDGRSLKKYRLDDYKWFTYQQASDSTCAIAHELLAGGVTSQSKVLIISETRYEWMLAAQAVIRTGASIVTLFSNLGLDGIHHGIIETQVHTVITSIDCMNILGRALAKGGHDVKRIIYFDSYKVPTLEQFQKYVITPLSEIEKSGRRRISGGQVGQLFTATPEHLMLIMYTSGTTGTPKAALLTHRQFAASMRALYVLVAKVIMTGPDHTYIAYLPMAHVLELTVELFLFFGGVRIGYGSPFTLTDSAPGLAKNVPSDMKLLSPTVMTCVPLVLDRILKEVSDKLRSRTPITEPLFTYLMNYKSTWTQRGYTCPITRSLLCSKVREQLGGGLQYMICGGAPLSGKTQSTIKAALDVVLIQGYGATETTGAALSMDFDDLSYGCVGVPLGGVKMRLKDWPEGGYSYTDRPCPRGEILIGGDDVCVGYFNLKQENEEAFVKDFSGMRWFRTGDIGQVEPNGRVRIIDRRKDLIKLQNGEYISLGKVESALKASQYVDNICVYGGTLSNDLVALITPNRKSFNTLAIKLNKQSLSISELCDDPEVEFIVQQDLQNVGKSTGLNKKEIPVRIRLVSEEWSPDNGILTAALKLKRKAIENYYKNEIDSLYSGTPKQIVISHRATDSNNNQSHRQTNGLTKDHSVTPFDHNNNNNDNNKNVSNPMSKQQFFERDVKSFVDSSTKQSSLNDIPASVKV